MFDLHFKHLMMFPHIINVNSAARQKIHFLRIFLNYAKIFISRIVVDEKNVG